MPAKNVVKHALEKLILRVSTGESANDCEITVLPEIVRTYLEFFGGKENIIASDEDRDSASSAQIVQLSGRFPVEGRVTVNQVAEFLGIKPGTVWKQVREQELPPPVFHKPRCTRWEAAEIRASRKNESKRKEVI
jgi:predicted DNA-binding transcriptional regulator AlpA